MLLVAMTNYHPSLLHVNTKCLLRCGKPCTASDSLDNSTVEKWESIREKSIRWKGLDRFQNECENVDWEKGPKSHHMHGTCYTSLSSKRCLSQVETRKRKFEEHIERDNTSHQEDPTPDVSNKLLFS